MTDGLLTDLRVEYNGLLLRSPRHEDVEALVRVYSHDFDLRPERLRGRGSPDEFRTWMRQRSSAHHRPVSVDEWKLEFLVEQYPGVVLGWATLEAEAFTRDRTFESNSWVEAGSRGQGHGTSIRHALISLAFDGLDAVVALSRAEAANEKSNLVSATCGYRNTGTGFAYLEDGSRVAYAHWELKREEREQLAVSAKLFGLEPFKAWLEASPPGGEGQLAPRDGS